jgi:hypothetical protein
MSELRPRSVPERIVLPPPRFRHGHVRAAIHWPAAAQIVRLPI